MKLIVTVKTHKRLFRSCARSASINRSGLNVSLREQLSAKTIALGIIGCGSHALSNLLPAVARTEGLDVAAISTRSAANAQRAFEVIGTKPWYTDYNKMLREETLDAAIVTVPTHLLGRVTIDSASAGVHVFSEKPMAASVAEAQEIIKAMKEANRQLMVGYCQRYAKARLMMKQLLEKGVVGKIEVMTAGKGNTRPSGWRLDREGGGILRWLGCHVIDQIMWLTNSNVKEVYGEVNRSDGCEVDETAVFSVRLSNGAIASANCTMLTPTDYDFIEVRGAEGFIRSEWYPKDVNSLHVLSKNVGEYSDLTTMEVIENDSLGWRNMFKQELLEFRRAIVERRSPQVDGVAGESVLRVIEAVLKSGETKRPVIF